MYKIKYYGRAYIKKLIVNMAKKEEVMWELHVGIQENYLAMIHQW